MREIKYRAWDEIGEWMGNVTSFDFNEGAVFIETKHSDDENRFDMNNVPVMQYTGLKDRNGKEIFEGDIVRFIKNRVRVGTRRAKVGRSYESYGIYEDREIVGVIEQGVFEKGLRDKLIPCLMVNTSATTEYQHYFWGEGKRTDRPDTSVDNLSEPLYSDKEYEVIGNVYENSELLEELQNGTE